MKKRFFCIFMTALCMFSTTFACRPAFACLNFLHEWIQFAGTSEELPNGAAHGLAEACLQFRKDIGERLASESSSPLTITLAGVTWGATASPASLEQFASVVDALECTWPASSVFALAKALPNDDFDNIGKACAAASTPLIVTVEVASCTADTIHLLDFIFFDIAIVRTILRENVTATFRVVNKAGDMLYLNKFVVSPTIIFDVMFRPTISLLSYFEKHDSKPWILDYGEIFKDVDPSAFENRPESFRMPDYDTSIPMPDKTEASKSRPIAP